MKFVIVPMGSAGDVHPLIWLGKILQHRGHDVVMICQRVIAQMPAKAGIRTLMTGDERDQERIRDHPDLWHPRRAFKLISQHMLAAAREMLPPVLNEIAGSDPDSTVLIAGSIAFAGRIASEQTQTPLLSVHLQPSIMMSAEEPGVPMAGAEWLQRVPKWLRRALIRAVHWDIDRRLSEPLGHIRKNAGIDNGPPRGIMKDWWHSPDGVLCLFPDWYAHRAPDWPRQCELTRFPLYDETHHHPLDPTIQEFLDAGDEPVVITPGSANSQAADFIRQAVEGCARAGRRAIVVTRYPEQTVGVVPDWVKVVAYVPFSRLFPHAAAVIHHGGIGTTAQCLAAGTPQLIMPMAHDQPDNAARIKKLGVGDYLYPRSFKPAAIARKLEHLTTSGDVAAACANIQARVRSQMSSSAVGELVEMLAERALRVRQINGAGVPA